MLAKGDGTTNPFARAPFVGVPDPDGEDFCHRLLVKTIEDTGADSGWLYWSGEPVAVVVGREKHRIPPFAFTALPDAPLKPSIVNPESSDDPWAQWCAANAISWCAVNPIFEDGRSVGMIGVARSSPGEVAPGTLRRLAMVGWLADEARKSETRINQLESQLEHVNRVVDTLAIDRVLTNVSDQNLAEAVGRSLDATYCLLAVLRRSSLVVLGGGGHRPPEGVVRGTSWPLAAVASCERALATGRSVVLDFDLREVQSERDRDLLFSPTTRTGIIVPFLSASSHGVLLVGEERRSQRQSAAHDNERTLQFLAKRVGEILGATTLLRHARRKQRRQQTLMIQTTERARLAVGLHDDVGQALNALLVRIRWAINQRGATTDDLHALEAAATDALGATRALAYGLRQAETDTEPLEAARHFCEAMLQVSGCRLSWIDSRNGATLSPQAARELAQVIKESIVNVVRHAHATTAHVSLESGDFRVRATIQDNGVGFVPDSVRVDRDGRGLGLLGNAERLKQVGGLMKIESSSGAGTRVIVEVPANKVA